MADQPRKRNYLVLWSGGCDSTLVIHQLLKRPDTGKVRAVSIVHENVGAVMQQRAARAALLPLLPGVDHFEVHVHTDKHDRQLASIGSGTSQVLLWMSAILPVLEAGETLATGHTLDDGGFWRLYPHARAMFDAASTLRQAWEKEEMEAPRWVVPLEWMTKANVLDQLLATPLYALCWYCESPNGIARCGGSCLPCKDHVMALDRIVAEAAHQDALTKAVEKLEADANPEGPQG